MAVGTPYLIGGNSIASGSTTVTITLGSGVSTAAGDAIIVSGGIGAGGVSIMPLTVTDTQGNLYQLLNSYSVSGGTYQYVSLNSAALSHTGNGGSADVITATYATVAQAKQLVAIGCSGVASANALDQIGASAGNSASPSTSAPNLLQSGDLAVAVAVYDSTGGIPTWSGTWGALDTTSSGSLPIISVATKTIAGTTGPSPSATITSAHWAMLVLTLSPGQNVSGALTGTVGYCATLSAGVKGASGSFSSTLSLSGTLNGQGSSVGSSKAKSLSNYGLEAIPVSNQSGHGLIAFVAWNGAEINPVANVADDAHNFWSHLGTTSVTGDIRCSIWAAPNAQAATVVSVGLTWFAQGLAVVIGELAGFPNWIAVDGAVVTSFNNSASSLTLTGSATAQLDLALCCIANGDNQNGAIPGAPGNGWSKIGQSFINDSGGAGGPADTGLAAYWKEVPQGNTPSATFSNGGMLGPLSGVLVSLSLTPSAPVQKNPNMPGMHYEAAFGYTPGDPTVMPTWTDITARVIGASGEQSIKAQRGRQYESEGPEAGELDLQLDNHDGAFTPGNASSPYYPNVLLGTPVRAWGTWSGRAYAVGSGYIERFPQTWPDGMTQYGVSPMVAPDALDPLSNSQMPSAYAGEILADNPYGYWNFGDIYAQNGAAGMPFANLSRTNQRPFIGEDGIQFNANGDGTLVYSRLQTGLSWFQTITGQSVNFIGGNGQGLTGDPTTSAIGVTNFRLTSSYSYCGGAYYTAPDLPQAVGGMTFEFWAVIPGLASTSHYQELLRVDGAAPNYYYGHDGGVHRGCRFLVRVNPGPAGSTNQDFIALDFMDFEGNDDAWGFTGTFTDGVPHHFVITVGLAPGGSNYSAQVFIDGTLRATRISSGVNVETDWSYIGVGSVAHKDGGLSWGFNYTFGHFALFPAQLTTSRIGAHYAAASTGGSGDDSVTRAAKLFTYGGFGLQRACAPPSPTPFMGPADQIQGQSVVDAFSTMATAEGGMLFVDAAGNVTWWPRSFLFNRPVKWTLGDGPGETPYDPGEAYDFDNTFINNYVTSQRLTADQSNGALAVAVDLPSQKQYFIRTGLAESIETTSDQDAYDQANWLLAQYKQPQIRVQQVVLNPAANPAIWPVALGIEQGDIAMLNRRPLGGAVLSQKCIVQMVSHAGGPDNWTTTVNLVPYLIGSSVLQCDASGFNVVGNNNLGW